MKIEFKQTNRRDWVSTMQAAVLLVAASYIALKGICAAILMVAV